MSDSDLTASAILKDWVLRLRLGNEITPEGWAEIMLAIDRLLPEEDQSMRDLINGLLDELGYDVN